MVGGLFIGFSLLFGPKNWHSGASMQLVHNLGASWTAWGLSFIVYCLLLCNHKTRVFGYFIGFILYSFYTGSFVVASVEGRLTNVVLLVVLVNSTIQQAIWGIKTMIEEARR